MNTTVARRWALWVVLAAGLGVGCGDSAASSDDDGEEMEGEKCKSPGAGAQCLCEDTMVLGTKRCGMDGYWTECTCGPRRGDSSNCIEGEQFRCCAGTALEEIVTCTENGGQISCACGGGDGGATDATVPAPVDAGQDSASASGSDAG